MKYFIKINKIGLIIFWLAFAVNLFVPLGDVASIWVTRIGVALLAIHAVELVFVFKGLKRIERAAPVDMVWVLLIGLFHWKPLLSK
jgi:uncharacterized protein YhhL (DUF1145 family)